MTSRSYEDDRRRVGRLAAARGTSAGPGLPVRGGRGRVPVDVQDAAVVDAPDGVCWPSLHGSLTRSTRREFNLDATAPGARRRERPRAIRATDRRELPIRLVSRGALTLIPQSALPGGSLADGHGP